MTIYVCGAAPQRRAQLDASGECGSSHHLSPIPAVKYPSIAIVRAVIDGKWVSRTVTILAPSANQSWDQRRLREAMKFLETHFGREGAGSHSVDVRRRAQDFGPISVLVFEPLRALDLDANELPIKHDCDEKQQQTSRHDNRRHKPASHVVPSRKKISCRKPRGRPRGGPAMSRQIRSGGPSSRHRHRAAPAPCRCCTWLRLG